MRLIHKDIFLLLLLTVVYNGLNFIIRQSSLLNKDLYINLLENCPYHMIITLLVYALLTIFNNVIHINDCEKEYSELLTQIENEEKKLGNLYKNVY